MPTLGMLQRRTKKEKIRENVEKPDLEAVRLFHIKGGCCISNG
jgi:hypothetical protein